MRLPKPGKYWLLASPDGGTRSSGALANLVVAAKPEAPAVGSRAIASETPTLASTGGKLAALTTATHPDPRLYRLSVAQALARHVPFVLTFATPKFCQSRTCGPVVDVVDAVAKKLSSTPVRFIHVEIYKDNDPAKGFNRWVNGPGSWNLPNEPFTFLVDRRGIIRAKLSGAFSVGELEQDCTSRRSFPPQPSRRRRSDPETLDHDLRDARAGAEPQEHAHDLGTVFGLNHLIAGKAVIRRHRGVDEAGAESVDPHPVRVERRVQRVRERDHRRFRRRVDRKERHRLRAGDRGQVDDETVRSPQVRQSGPGDENQPAEVHVELQVDPLHVLLVDFAGHPNPGRVDQDVEAVVNLDVCGHGALAVVWVPDVRDDLLGRQLRRRRFELVAGACRERQRKTFVSEHSGDRKTDPRRAAGDERRAHAASLAERRRPPGAAAVGRWGERRSRGDFTRPGVRLAPP